MLLYLANVKKMMNQLYIRRQISMVWLLVLCVGLLAPVGNASNRERIERQHHQRLDRSHHHKHNNGAGMRRTISSSIEPSLSSATELPSSTIASTALPTYRHRLTTMATDSAKKMIAVKASLNGNIFMRCPIEDIIEDFQVSWVRLPDWRIIASGRRIYNKDERFRVLHVEGTTDWTLQIKFAVLADEGLYECQVSTATGIVTYYYNVSVIVPTTTIVGGSEYHVDKGSAIQLACVIHNIPHEPQFIFWYHNDRMINYDSTADNLDDSALDLENDHRTKYRHRPRVEVSTETDRPLRGDNQNLNDEYQDRIVYSQLTIHDVTDIDSGNYTCSPSNAEPASTLVYVSEGDDAAAAIQVGETNASDVMLNSPGTSSASASSVAASNAVPLHIGKLTFLVPFSCLCAARYTYFIDR